MNPKTIITELRRINAWRRGDETVGQPAPGHFGDVLDAAAESLASLVASNTTLRRERSGARAELKQRKADVTRMEEYLLNSGRNMDEAQEQIAGRDSKIVTLSADLARVTAERRQEYDELREASSKRENALRASVAEVEVQAERYRLATLRQDADLARVTAERDHAQGITEKLPNVSVPQPCQMRAELAEASLKVAREQISALRARVAELDRINEINAKEWESLHSDYDTLKQRNAELVAALREIAEETADDQHETLEDVAVRLVKKVDRTIRSRAESATPAKHCEDCAPEFGCWDGGESCYKQPLQSSTPAKHPDTERGVKHARKLNGLAAWLEHEADVRKACATNEGDRWDAMRMSECAEAIREYAAPAKHPDTERMDWLEKLDAALVCNVTRFWFEYPDGSEQANRHDSARGAIDEMAAIDDARKQGGEK